jgi:protein gp37
MPTTIEWAEESWNPVIGCAKVSPGCKNCYAERMSARLANMGQANYQCVVKLDHERELALPQWNGVVKCLPEKLEQPLKWKKGRTIFVCSMGDLFHKDVPFDFLDKVFAVISLCPQHFFIILTKRPERVPDYFATIEQKPSERDAYDCPHRSLAPRIGQIAGSVQSNRLHKQEAFSDLASCSLYDRLRFPFRNVVLGTSISTQPDADKQIPYLLRCPAAYRMLSVEPLLEAMRLPLFTDDGEDMPPDERRDWGLPATIIQSYGAPPGTKIDQVIVGGESGPGARPCSIDWIRSIGRQCEAADVRLFVKQWGSNPCASTSDGTLVFWPKLNHPKGGDPSEWPEDLRVREVPPWPGKK